MITSTKLYALILVIRASSLRDGLYLFIAPPLKHLCDDLPSRAGVDSHQHDDKHEYRCRFHRGQTQNPIHEPDTDSRQEQAADYDPEGQHCFSPFNFCFFIE